ncbi:MAG TPA: FAD-dependent oxidoreductase, partial [Candidatus Deferrimicrobium sp.]
MSHDFVVIGAGVSGMTSALVMARNGYRVTLLEKAGHTAPLLRGFSRGGVHFDTGFHYTGGMGRGEPLDLFLRYLGLSGRVKAFPFREGGFDVLRCRKEGFEFHFPSGYEAIRERLTEAFPREKDAVGEYLRRVKATLESVPYLNPGRADGSGVALERIMGSTLKDTLDSLTGDPLLKALLSMHCLLYGVSPEEVSFAQHACVVGNYYLSACGIEEGGRGLARGFDEGLERAGVDVRCGSGVAGLSVDSRGELSGVRLADGTFLPCGGCIATVHPRLLLDMVPPGSFRPVYRKRIEGLEETVSAFMLYSVSDGPVPSLAGRNIFAFPSADSIYGLGGGSIEDGPLYITAAYREGGGEPRGAIAIFPTLPGSTGAWEGSATGRRPEEYLSFKRHMVERMQRMVESAGPEFDGTTRPVEASTPLTLRDFNNTPVGGLYGLKHKAGQYNPGSTTRIKG